MNPLFISPNWTQERGILRNRIILTALLVALELVGVYDIADWALQLLIPLGLGHILMNAWALWRRWAYLPSLNFVIDQLFTLFLLAVAGGGDGPMVFLTYLHVVSGIVFFAKSPFVFYLTLMQLINLFVGNSLSLALGSGSSWAGVVFHGIGLVVITLTFLRPASDLHDEASTDPLTGALNRRSGMRTLERWFNEAHPFSLLFIDLKRFKSINDNHGHSVGDEVLELMSTKLRESIREHDELIRFGGDEFLIATRGESEAITERLRGALLEPLATSVGALHIGVDIGVVRYPEDAGTLEQLISTADQRMYAVKQAPREAL